MTKKKPTKKTPRAASADVKALRFAALFLNNHAEKRESDKHYIDREWLAKQRRTAKRLVAIAKRLDGEPNA